MNRWSRLYPPAVAVSALLLGCVIYLVARPASVFFVGGELAVPFIGQLPSFLHTLAFALFGSFTMTRHAFAVILSWGAVELLAELAQHRFFPVPQVFQGYRQTSTFDVLDMVAIVAATVIAMQLTRKSISR